MNTSYDVNFIYDQIKSGFGSLKILAQKSLEPEWGNLTCQERYMAEHALFVMGQVAAKPAQYFSRAKTERKWNEAVRLAYTARRSGLDVSDELAPSPVRIVCDRVAGAFVKSKSLENEYNSFCRTVFEWEYDRTSDVNIECIFKCNYGQIIVDMVRRLRKEADIAQSSKLARPFKELYYRLQRQR